MGKKEDMYDMIKPEDETGVIAPEVEKTEYTPTPVEKQAKIPGGGMNKDTIVIISVVVGMLLICAGIILYYFLGVQNAKVTTFNGGYVTRAEYETYYRFLASDFAYYGYGAEDIKTYLKDKAALDKIISKKAAEEGFNMSDEAKQEIDGYFNNQEFITTQQSKGLDIGRLKEILYNDALVTDYVNSKVDQATAEDVKANIIAEEGEKADLNLYVTRHILFSFTDSTTGEAKDKAKLKKDAEAVLKKVKNGENFANLAEKHSDDSSSTEGGKYEMANNDTQTVEEYRKAVLTLKAGKIYPKLVETEYGYHIIMLESITKNGRLTYLGDKQNYISKVVSGIEENANIKTNDNLLSQIVESLSSATGVSAE